MSRQRDPGWSGAAFTPARQETQMPPLRSSSHKKSTKSAVHPSSSNPEATTAPAFPTEVAATAAAPGVAPPAPVPKSIRLTAAEAIAQLDALEAKLGLDIVISPNDKHQNRALNRVSDTALGLAADIVGAAPARFPDFSAIAPGASYVQEMAPLAARLGELAGHVQKSIQNQRAPASQQTLALYSVVKGLGRIVDNETMREKVTKLKAEIAIKPKAPKPKVTRAEKVARTAAKRLQARLDKAAGLLIAHGRPVPGTPSPVSVPPADKQVALVAPAATASGATAVTNGGAPPANAAH
jgi:hypothetical protein